jgi:hypothetical protein
MTRPLCFVLMAPLRALPYSLDPAGKPAAAPADMDALAARLREARSDRTDSPVFQLVEGFPDIQRLKTDVFRDRVKYGEEAKGRLAARKQGPDTVRAVEASLGRIADEEAGVVIDRFLSYRAVRAWGEMMPWSRRWRRPWRQPSSCRSSSAWRSTAPGAGTRRSGADLSDRPARRQQRDLWSCETPRIPHAAR